MSNNLGLEGTRLEESGSPVHEMYPDGSVGHMIVRGERTYLGGVIELPCGHWQGHFEGGEKREDPFDAIRDVLGYRDSMLSNEIANEEEAGSQQ